MPTSVIFKAVKHFFPIRGHSFLPPDRFFGRIEKVVRKKETTLSPLEYYRIFVKNLIAFFEIPEDEKDFYACVLGSVEGVMQDEVDEFDENEPFV